VLGVSPARVVTAAVSIRDERDRHECGTRDENARAPNERGDGDDA
jgi:hypothetical protein